MSKSLLYAVNSNQQTTTAIGTELNAGSVVRRYGCNCNVSGGEVTIRGEGYYNIDTDVTFVAGGAGVATVTVNKNGTAIPGAVASVTVADGDTASVSISATVREICCCADTITVVVSGVISEVTNYAIRVTKE